MMVSFYFICAALIVSVVGVLFISFRKDRSDDKENKLSKNTLVGLVCLVPVAAVGLYFVIGTPRAVQVAPTKAALTEKPIEGHDLSQMEQLVERLASRLEKQPNDVEGWMLLARSYAVLGHSEKAKAALSRANALEKKDTTFVSRSP